MSTVASHIFILQHREIEYIPCLFLFYWEWLRLKRDTLILNFIGFIASEVMDYNSSFKISIVQSSSTLQEASD